MFHWPAVQTTGATSLIESGHGLLGAIGSAPSALAVAARDQWIAWPSEVRRVLCPSRFLIRLAVEGRLPASKVLGMSLRRLPDDVRRRWGCRPALLETFVNARQHAGTCFRAANWSCVGEAANQRLPVRRVFGCPLLRDWLGVLRAEAPPIPRLSGLAAGLAPDQFAENELEKAPLCALRSTGRLEQTAQMQAAAPTASIPAAAQGSRAAVMGHCRCIDRKQGSAVTP